MKKIFIIFLFIIFSSSFSLAKNNEKITVEEIEDIFFGRYEKKKDNETWQSFFDRRGKERTRRLQESIKREKRMREEKNPYMRPKSVGNYQEDEKKWEEYLRVVANLDDHIGNTADPDPEGWECIYCGENTHNAEYDYLVSSTEHLSCKLNYEQKKPK